MKEIQKQGFCRQCGAETTEGHVIKSGWDKGSSGIGEVCSVNPSHNIRAEITFATLKRADEEAIRAAGKIISVINKPGDKEKTDDSTNNLGDASSRYRTLLNHAPSQVRTDYVSKRLILVGVTEKV